MFYSHDTVKRFYNQSPLLQQKMCGLGIRTNFLNEEETNIAFYDVVVHDKYLSDKYTAYQEELRKDQEPQFSQNGYAGFLTCMITEIGWETFREELLKAITGIQLRARAACDSEDSARWNKIRESLEGTKKQMVVY